MTDKLIVFHQDYPLSVFVLALVLLAGLVVREWVRENPRRKVLRVVVAVLLGMATMSIIYRPAIKRSLDKSNLILLTDGYVQSQLDSMKRVVPRADLRRVDTTVNAYTNLEAYGSIYVLGYGLPEYDLWQLEGLPVQFLGSAPLTGLTRMHFPRQSEQERKLTIRGKFITNENTWLFLKGAEGKLDSAQVRAEQPDFELAFVPKTVGNFIYTLTDFSGNLSEKIPLVIQPSKKLKVLMINAFPTFETRYLKNYLARKGNEVTVRNQVSKGVFRTEFYNTPEIPINQLTNQLITAQDVLIIDLQSLENLTRAERSALNNAIQNEGVGLFIQPEDDIFRKSDFLSIERIPIEEEMVSGNLAGTSVTLAQYGFQLRKSNFQITLLEDDQHLFALAERSGLGKIGTTVLRDTYRQNLNGDSLIYANIWSGILNGLAKPNEGSTTLFAQDEVVYPREPYIFEIQSPLGHRSLGEGDQYSAAQIPKLQIADLSIPLAQDAAIPERWQGTYWSRQAGWQQIVTDSDTIPFYIHEQGQWQEKRAYDRVGANETFFSKHASQNNAQLFQHRAIPMLWFYLVFLLCAGFLWLEPKL